MQCRACSKISLNRLQTKQLVSSTDAHSDFVKALLVIPTVRLLVSSGSDKIVRLWYEVAFVTFDVCLITRPSRDISRIVEGQPLTSVGTLTDHTRPVEALDARILSNGAAVLYTGDTMGVIKVWEITKDDGTPPRWKSKLQGELSYHRTRVDDMVYGNGHLWTGEWLPNFAVFRSHIQPCSIHG